jgi:hypothetical protein
LIDYVLPPSLETGYVGSARRLEYKTLNFPTPLTPRVPISSMSGAARAFLPCGQPAPLVLGRSFSTYLLFSRIVPVSHQESTAVTHACPSLLAPLWRLTFFHS